MDLKSKFDWLDDIPDEFKSRKLVLIIFTMLLLFVVAITATITSHWLGFNEGIWRDVMLYITGAGTSGTVAQAVPDVMQARNGTYRQGYFNAPEKVTASPYPNESAVPTTQTFLSPEEVINMPPKPQVSERTRIVSQG